MYMHTHVNSDKQKPCLIHGFTFRGFGYLQSTAVHDHPDTMSEVSSSLTLCYSAYILHLTVPHHIASYLISSQREA